MMSLTRFTILVIFGVVTSQNHDANLQTQKTKKSVEATTLIPPDPTIKDEELRFLLTRLESLCVENLQFLITETNRRFQFLESQISEENNMLVKKLDNLTMEVGRNSKILEARDENLGKNIQELMDATRNLPSDVRAIKQNVSSIINVTRSQSSEVHSTVNNLLVKKLDNWTSEVGRMSQCCSVPATPVVQNCEIFDAKVENLGKNIQDLMDTTRNLPSDVEVLKQNVSSLINVTRSIVHLSSSSEVKQICNEKSQEMKVSQTPTSTSSPLNLTLDKRYPKNCREVQESEKTSSGTFMIQPQHAPKPFEVVCELTTRGGGWTVIQRRFDGSQDFYLDWQHYKNGFGNLGGEFWLGLENIHLLTGFEVNELLIELGDFDSQNASAFYSEFNVGSEMEGFVLKVLGAYSGDTGDSFTQHVGKKFSTKDNYQDYYGTNCAKFCNGGWWYINCANNNLNGKYADHRVPSQSTSAGIFWNTFKDSTVLKHTKMLVRPKV